MPELPTATEARLRRLGWKILGQNGGGRDADNRERILLAENTVGGTRFRMFVHCLEATGPWIFYRRPSKTIARPEALAGIIPLDISSCNLPLWTLTFVRKNARFTFHYAEEGLEAESGRDLMPGIAPAAALLRRLFLRNYLHQMGAAETGREKGGFYLNLLVTGDELITLQPEEVQQALASGNPAELAWETGYVPLHLPPRRLEQFPGAAASRDGNQAEILCRERISVPASRLRYLLEQLPGIYWMIADQHLEESLRFILSYACRWHSSPLK